MEDQVVIWTPQSMDVVSKPVQLKRDGSVSTANTSKSEDVSVPIPAPAPSPTSVIDKAAHATKYGDVLQDDYDCFEIRKTNTLQDEHEETNSTVDPTEKSSTKEAVRDVAISQPKKPGRRGLFKVFSVFSTNDNIEADVKKEKRVKSARFGTRATGLAPLTACACTTDYDCGPGEDYGCADSVVLDVPTASTANQSRKATSDTKAPAKYVQGNAKQQAQKATSGMNTPGQQVQENAKQKAQMATSGMKIPGQQVQGNAEQKAQKATSGMNTPVQQLQGNGKKQGQKVTSETKTPAQQAQATSKKQKQTSPATNGTKQVQVQGPQDRGPLLSGAPSKQVPSLPERELTQRTASPSVNFSNRSNKIERSRSPILDDTTTVASQDDEMVTPHQEDSFKEHGSCTVGEMKSLLSWESLEHTQSMKFFFKIEKDDENSPSLGIGQRSTNKKPKDRYEPFRAGDTETFDDDITQRTMDDSTFRTADDSTFNTVDDLSTVRTWDTRKTREESRPKQGATDDKSTGLLAGAHKEAGELLADAREEAGELLHDVLSVFSAPSSRRSWTPSIKGTSSTEEEPVLSEEDTILTDVATKETPPIGTPSIKQGGQSTKQISLNGTPPIKQTSPTGTPPIKQTSPTGTPPIKQTSPTGTPSIKPTSTEYNEHVSPSTFGDDENRKDQAKNHKSNPRKNKKSHTKVLDSTVEENKDVENKPRKAKEAKATSRVPSSGSPVPKPTAPSNPSNLVDQEKKDSPTRGLSNFFRAKSPKTTVTMELPPVEEETAGAQKQPADLDLFVPRGEVGVKERSEAKIDGDTNQRKQRHSGPVSVDEESVGEESVSEETVDEVQQSLKTIQKHASRLGVSRRRLLRSIDRDGVSIQSSRRGDESDEEESDDETIDNGTFTKDILSIVSDAKNELVDSITTMFSSDEASKVDDSAHHRKNLSRRRMKSDPDGRRSKSSSRASRRNHSKARHRPRTYSEQLAVN